ncbi:MAG: DUF1156 domain-containing protein [Anaerolineae bacterium]|nr:DUF1156 domain-containing protein [Anaerolineae bacterium]
MIENSKRLIEHSLPLDAISAQSAREKSIRHGHISTLHIWWARRPLAACRAAVFSALVDAPDDPAERERLEKLIITIVDWDQVKAGNSPAIEQARRIIQEQWGDETPRVLDMFAGGGAIPLEALRLGCEAHALDLNPVAYLLLLCTLVYPQRYAEGVPGSARAPEQGHLPSMEPTARQLRMEGLDAPPAERTLADDVRRWGEWVLEEARQEIGQFYEDPDGGTVVAYLWARTARCPNPACGAEMPLVRQWWLARRGKRKRVALKPIVDRAENEITFEVVRGDEIDFDPGEGTMRRGSVTCLCCGQTADANYLRREGKAGRLGEMPMGVVLTKPGELGKAYRPVTDIDHKNYAAARNALQNLKAAAKDGSNPLPSEPIPTTELRRLSVPLYGMDTWGKLFNARQALAVITFSKQVQQVYSRVVAETQDPDYAQALVTYLALAVDRLADYLSTGTRWRTTVEAMAGTFGRQALAMVWDYPELNPLGDISGWDSSLGWIEQVIRHCAAASSHAGNVKQGTATRLPYPDNHFDAVITDPPYYDAVPYSHLADFFYVWLKRILGDVHPDVFRTPLTPKGPEIVQDRPHSLSSSTKNESFYEHEMTRAFREAARVLKPRGLFVVVFAHKSTAAWETLISSLLNSGLVVTASWPLHTERPGRMIAYETAALASSIFLVCRKHAEARDGYFDAVRGELQARIRERLDFFWEQGIRGADFFISAIGPAVEVFGRYTAVRRLSGQEVTVGELLDLVQQIVADYALSRILHNGSVGHVDPVTRFYVLWRWSYAGASVPFDDARKLAQAQGAEVDELMSRLGILKKRGENVDLLGPRQRSKDEDLGEPGPGGRPVPLIDVLHRACLLWNQGDRTGLAEFLGRTGHASDEAFWSLAQDLSDVLPEGDKEKQMLQGLVGNKERVVSQVRQERLL